jgi:hypothetical protein
VSLRNENHLLISTTLQKVIDCLLFINNLVGKDEGSGNIDY